MLRATHSLRTLERRDREAVLRVCALDPMGSVMLAERVQRSGSEPLRLGGEIWGYFDQDELRSMCWAGANLVPVQATSPAALDAFAERARRRGGYSSMFGPAEAVLGLWQRLSAAGWQARQVRPCQPLYAIEQVSSVPVDPQVHRGTPGDLDAVLPASIAMFTEEVGYSPVVADGDSSYRRRVAELLREGRTFVRLAADGQVLFKADLGAVSASTAQVHGVWLDPRFRGRGLAAPAMAAVVAAALRTIAPSVSLYVNDYNGPALSAYRRVGFQQVGTFATVLF